MKKLLITVFSFGVSLLSVANPLVEPLKELTTVRSTYKKVHITFEAPMEKVFISILDANGDQISKSKYRTKEAVTVPFNLSALPAGDYQVKIETKDEVEIYPIKTVEKKSKNKPLMAYGKIKNRNTLNLLVVGLEQPGVSIDIYNEFNRKIGSEYIDQPEGFSKDYKFVNQNAGKIYFHVKDVQGRSKYVYPKIK